LKDIGSTRSSSLDITLIDGYNPDTFIQRKDYRIIEEMLSDDSISGILDVKKYMILSTGYVFTCEDEEENKEILDFIYENFESKYIGRLSKDLYNVLTSYEYGFSLSEKIFAKEENKIWLKRIKTLPQPSVDFYTDDLGILEKVEQTQTSVGKAVELPMSKFILLTNNGKYDNPYGLTELRKCYAAWFAKKLVIKLWGIYLQRFASPFPVAKVDNADLGDTKVAYLRKMLDSIQQTVSLILPKNVDLELKETSSSRGDYDMAIERFNQMIGRALLMPDLIGFGAKIDGGSYALGQKQYDLFLMTLEYQRQELEELINEQVIKQLVEINFGKRKVYPKFQFNPFNNDNLLELLKVFITAVEKGMPVNSSDWNELRAKIGAKELTEQEIVDIESKAKEALVNLNPQDAVNPIDDKTPNESKTKDKSIKPINNPEELDKGDNKEQEDRVSNSVPYIHHSINSNDGEHKFSDLGFEIYREPSKFEARVDFVNEAKQIIRQEDFLIDTLAERFQAIRDNLKQTIIKKDIIKDSKYEEVDKLNLRYLGDVKALLKTGINSIYKDGRDNAMAEIRALKKSQNFASAGSAYITDEASLKIADSLIDANTFQAIGKLKNSLLDNSKQILITGLKDGKGENEIMKELDGVFSSVVKGSIDASLSYEPTLLRTIVRTNYNTFYNLGRKQVANGSDFVQMLEYSAILDPRTTEICMSLDGKIYPKADPIWDSITPPNHFNAILAGSKIRTDKGLTNIENIKIGDKVLTHKGNYKEVYDTMNKFEDKHYYTIELEDGKNIDITGEHPVLTGKGWKRADEIEIDDDIITIEDIHNNICPICGKGFYAAPNSKAKYCSYACNNKSRTLDKSMTCHQCGKEYTGSKESMYCSRECHHKSMVVTRYCKCCGEEIKSKYKKKNSVFCSKLCNIKFMIDNRRLQYCEHCGKEIHNGFNGKRFCSFSCSRKFRGETRIEKPVREYFEQENIHFEQEKKFNNYLADFFIPSMNLVIEVDGGYWHSSEKAIKSDSKKDKLLTSLGHKVLRIKEESIKNGEYKYILKEALS